MLKNAAHKNNKKRAGSKNEAGGDEKHLFFLLGLNDPNSLLFFGAN